MNSIREWLNGRRDYSSGAKLYEQFGDDLLLKRMFSEPETDFKRKSLVSALEGLWEKQKQAIPATLPVQQPKPSQPAAPFKIKRVLVKTKKELSEAEEIIQEKNSEIEDLEWEKLELEEENEDLQDKLKKARSRNGWPLEMDSVLQELHNQWKAKFLEMVDLQSRIFETGKEGITNKAKEKEAGIMALRILDLREEVIEFYYKRDHYIKSGSLPEVPLQKEECLDPAIFPTKLANAERTVREWKNKLSKIPENEDKRRLKALHKLQFWEGEVSYYRKLLKKD